MRACEFIDEETVDEYSEIHPQIRRDLEDKGYERLGYVVDQAAYSDPDDPNQVLKIFGTNKETRYSKGQTLSGEQKWGSFGLSSV